jgi:hypothetical protein
MSLKPGYKIFTEFLEVVAQDPCAGKCHSCALWSSTVCPSKPLVSQQGSHVTPHGRTPSRSSSGPSTIAQGRSLLVPCSPEMLACGRSVQGWMHKPGCGPARRGQDNSFSLTIWTFTSSWCGQRWLCFSCASPFG